MIKSARLAFGVLSLCAVSAFANAPADKTAALTDDQISDVLETAHVGELKAAKMAVKKAENADVKAYAQMMADAHKTAEQDTHRVAKEMHLRSKGSPLSKELRTANKQMEKDLKGKKGAEFDVAYIDGMVDGHQKVLDTYDNVLIPSARAEGLKTLLQKQRADVQAHLDKAKEIQSTIKR